MVPPNLRQRPRRGVFPGSFNPLTVAHLEVARRAREEMDLDEIHLMVSRVALDKPQPPGPSFEERLALLEADAAATDWLSVHITEKQLIVDIAMGYDVVVMGADKWIQVNDAQYYESAAARDEALERLPEVIVAQRSGAEILGATMLATDESMHDVSSTQARDGARHVMAPEAAARWHQPPHIRLAEAHEVDMAASIYIESRRQAVPDIPPMVHTAASVRVWFSEVLVEDTEIWLAVDGGEAMAMLALTPGWVEHLYVRPDHVGRGIGSALIRHAQSRSTTLDLWTFQSNSGAQRFYERHGFVEIARTDGDNEEGQPDVRFRWVAEPNVD